MTTICPECGSDRISERHIGRKTGSIVGGAAGALSGAGTGAAIGSVVPVVGTATGAVIGALLGRFALGQRLELLRVLLWMGCCLTDMYVESVSIHSIDCIDIYCPSLPQPYIHHILISSEPTLLIDLCCRSVSLN